MSRIFTNVFSVDDMKKTGFHGYVPNFSVDYDVIAVDAVWDISNYMMKNMIYESSNNINKIVGYIKKIFIAAIKFVSSGALKYVPVIDEKCKYGEY